MKVNFYSYSNKTSYYNNQQSFKGIKFKKQTLYDLFIRTPVGYTKPNKSLTKIKHIEPQYMAGTKCQGSIPLKNFWDFFEKNEYVKNCGYSTNTEGYGNSFLKANILTPLSTSYVHDCSVMHIYNKKTGTHALYHALPNCSYSTLKYMLKALMPEGYTGGAIVPGDSMFYCEQEQNMKNMFKLLTRSNPDAIVNVYHSTCRYPEIVGCRGEIYQIPNKGVQKQIKAGEWNIKDPGQASFKILDLQAYNTFENILRGCRTLESLEKLWQSFLNARFPEEILKILKIQIENKKSRI